jgi:methanogenic corrinoid protein MtbC1
MSATQVKSLLGKAGFSKEQQDKIVTETSNKIHNEPLKIKNKAAKVVKTSKNEIRKFLKALAQKESSSDPNIVNSLGYIGKYQMGQMALQDLELDDKINAHKFKKNPNIFPEKAQDKAMIKLLKLNKQYLGEYFNEFDGKVVGGVKITKSGLLAGSHLVGASAVKQFLDSNGEFVPKDGNDVPVTEYIQKFGGYQLTF